MTRVWVLQLPNGMASSLAITRDALETANQVSLRGGRRAPFDVQTVQISQTGRSTPVDFTRRDLLIVPGMNVRSEAELVTALATPTVRRATRIVAGRTPLGHSSPDPARALSSWRKPGCCPAGAQRRRGGWRQPSATSTQTLTSPSTGSSFPTGPSQPPAPPWRKWI